MAAGDVSPVYRASSNLTVTNLNSVGSSSTFTSGWTSGTIDNTTDKDLDKQVSVKITLGTTLTASEIRLYVYSMLDDTNWPDLFSAGTEGTEGTCTVHDEELLGSALKLLGVTATDTTNSQVYTIDKQSIAAAYGGVIPPKCALYIAHGTNANLAASGNQVTVWGSKVNIEQ